MIVSTEQLYAVWLHLSVATRPGYSARDVVDSGPDRPWLSDGTSWGLDVDLGSPDEPDFIAAFDVLADGQAQNVWSVRLLGSEQWQDGSGLQNPVEIAEGQVNGRGDCFFEIDRSQHGYAFYRLLFEAAGQPRQWSVGQVWLGRARRLTRTYTQRTDTLDHPTIINETESMGISAYAVASAVRTLRLPFGRLRQEEIEDLLSLVYEVEGARRPLVIVPGGDDHTGRPLVLHGRIQSTVQHTVDHPVYGGLTLEFTETGRSLGGY